MIKSMTGFGHSAAVIPAVGKVNIEIRSVNHRFLDVVCHLPDGFSYLEERVTKEIEKKIKRGRVTCLLNIVTVPQEKLLINKRLLREYHASLNRLSRQLNIREPLKLDTLIHLPGVLKIEEQKNYKNKIWSKLRVLLKISVGELAKTRSKEGQALYADLKKRSEQLKVDLEATKSRFKKVIQEKISQIASAEEKIGFLKSADITEEITRVRYHLHNFQNKLGKADPVGKELDFIAQELSRETNTMGAKSIDAIISSNVVGMKSQIEKIREQLQNVE